MTMFTYNTQIPFSTNNPSVDQPQMLINTVAINGIWSVDHVGFNSTGIGGSGSSGGQHTQVTFNGNNPPATAPSQASLSILYANTISGAQTYNTASASPISQLFYLNQSGAAMAPQPLAAFPVSMIKAFGSFDNNGNKLNCWNLTCTRVGVGQFNFQMPTGCVNSANYSVFCLAQASSTPGAPTMLAIVYSINAASPSNFTINFGFPGIIAFADPRQFSVMVMQL